MAQVYAVQFDIVWEDKDANHRQLEMVLEELRPDAGSLIVLPEMFDVGFTLNAESMCEEATDFSSQRWCARIANKYGLFLQGACIRREIDRGGMATNNAVVFDPSGELVCRYEKLVPFTGGRESEQYEGGRSLALFDWNGLRVCPFICYDLRFPELWRLAVMDMGCEMFTCGASWPAARGLHWTALLTARAIENQAFVVGVNRCGSDPNCEYDGGSIILDPVGRVLDEAGRESEVIQAEIDAHAVRAWREQFAVLHDAKREWLGRIDG